MRRVIGRRQRDFRWGGRCDMPVSVVPSRIRMVACCPEPFYWRTTLGTVMQERYKNGSPYKIGVHVCSLRSPECYASQSNLPHAMRSSFRLDLI